MGRYLGKCKGVVGDVAVLGVRTRARAALAMAATTTTTTSAKKIKRSVAASPTTSYNVHQLRSRRRVLDENSGSSTPSCRPETTSSSSDVVVVVETTANCSTSEGSSDFPASCCSSNVASSSCETAKDRLEVEIIADPEVESAQTSSTRHLDCLSETRKESKIGGSGSDNLDSPPRFPDSKSTVQIKMPSDSEIEDFFSAAEKDLQKRFSDKYNFDIVKDVPLEGRYEWVPIKQ